MAISPDETGYTPRELALIARIEKEIDGKLREQTAGHELRVIEFSMDSFIPANLANKTKRDARQRQLEKRVLPEVIKRYEEAGWKIQVDDEASTIYKTIWKFTPNMS